jgi:hypothetical protein
MSRTGRPWREQLSKNEPGTWLRPASSINTDSNFRITIVRSFPATAVGRYGNWSIAWHWLAILIDSHGNASGGNQQGQQCQRQRVGMHRHQLEAKNSVSWQRLPAASKDDGGVPWNVQAVPAKPTSPAS